MSNKKLIKTAMELKFLTVLHEFQQLYMFSSKNMANIIGLTLR